MRKEHILEEWEALVPGQDPLEWMEPVDPKTRGSKFGLDGLRIEGSAVFINAVLSNLKELLKGENDETRLMLLRATIGQSCKRLPPGMKNGRGCNAPLDNEVVYVRLVRRGSA